MNIIHTVALPFVLATKFHYQKKTQNKRKIKKKHKKKKIKTKWRRK